MKQEFKPGTFGRFWSDEGSSGSRFGYYVETNCRGIKFAPCKENYINGGDCFYADSFTPYHEPLPVEPSQKEWVKAAFELFPPPERLESE